MDVDLELLDSLIKANQTSLPPYTLHLSGKTFDLKNVQIIKSPTPVTSPTTRGGVYFADKFAYKLKGTVHDLSIVPLLTKTMLGPNTEFGEIKIMTEIENKGNVSIFTNLTNSVQGPSKVELNMIIIKIK